MFNSKCSSDLMMAQQSNQSRINSGHATRELGLGLTILSALFFSFTIGFYGFYSFDIILAMFDGFQLNLISMMILFGFFFTFFHLLASLLFYRKNKIQKLLVFQLFASVVYALSSFLVLLVFVAYLIIAGTIIYGHRVDASGQEK